MPSERAIDLKLIEKCCRNSVAMLLLADSGEPDLAKRKRLQTVNKRQAELLDLCADMLAFLASDDEAV